jgi:hypothetical protein
MKQKIKSLDESTKQLVQKLVDPINMLHEILKESLTGAYHECVINEPKKTVDDFIYIIKSGVVGKILIYGTNRDRQLIVCLKFDWKKMENSKTFLCLLFSDRKNVPASKHYEKNISVHNLEDAVEKIKTWLQGGKLPFRMNLKH